MKTRSALVMEAPNIAAIVKARHHARIVCPTSTNPSTSTQSQLVSGTINDPSENGSNTTNFCNAPTTGGQTVGDEVRVSAEDKAQKNRSAPTHEFQLPEDVWIELVPRTHSDSWRVIEAEQNPRLRLRVDINRQLSDVIALTENKWQSAAERMRTVLDLPVVNQYTPPSVMLNLCPAQSIDGAIRIQEVARVRSGDLGLRAYLDRMNTKVPPHQLQSNVCKTAGFLMFIPESTQKQHLGSIPVVMLLWIKHAAY
ncbi:unnamed protein product [Trichobilharzia regenti]|nr:unnamed protein product [Trichobilharzia regenti]